MFQQFQMKIVLKVNKNNNFRFVETLRTLITAVYIFFRTVLLYQATLHIRSRHVTLHHITHHKPQPNTYHSPDHIKMWVSAITNITTLKHYIVLLQNVTPVQYTTAISLTALPADQTHTNQQKDKQSASRVQMERLRTVMMGITPISMIVKKVGFDEINRF